MTDDMNAAPDSFVRDRFAGTTVRVSIASDGTEANYGASGQPRLSADGRFVAFQSYATTLVPGTGGFTNVYVRGIETAVALCVARPAENCRPTLRPAGSWLTIRKAPIGSRKGPQLQWKGGQGAATAITDFGIPTFDTQYAVCVYSPAGNPILQARVPPESDCISGGCWKSLGTRGFSFRGTGNVTEGVTAIRLRAGDERRASAVVKAHGDHLTLPALPVELPLVVQLQANNGQCWEATYSRNVVFNDEMLFKARAD